MADVDSEVEKYRQEIINRLDPHTIRERFPKRTDFVGWLITVNENYAKMLNRSIDRKTQKAICNYMADMDSVLSECCSLIRDRDVLLKAEDHLYGSLARSKASITHEVQTTTLEIAQLNQNLMHAIEATKTQPASNSSSQMDGSNNLMKDIAGIATKNVTNNKSGSFLSLWLYLILGLVIFLVGTAYVAAVKKSTDKWLLMQLQTVGVSAHGALRQQLPAMQAAFSSALQKTLEDSEAMLMETVVGFLSTNNGMSNAATVHTQLQALSDFTSDLQKLRM